jgi:hypothetical protein
MKMSGKIDLNIVRSSCNLHNVDLATLILRKIIKCISGYDAIPLDWKNQTVRRFLTDLKEVPIIVINGIQTNKVRSY